VSGGEGKKGTRPSFVKRGGIRKEVGINRLQTFGPPQEKGGGGVIQDVGGGGFVKKKGKQPGSGTRNRCPEAVEKGLVFCKRGVRDHVVPKKCSTSFDGGTGKVTIPVEESVPKEGRNVRPQRSRKADH